MYKRTPFSGGSIEDLQRYLDQELSKIEQHAVEVATETLRLKIAHSAPKRPEDATLAYADGTDWNPGQGYSLYQYNGGWNGILSITPAGLLSLKGTGVRIQADFSNATASNRAAFQTSTTNGNTIINLISNGTAANSQIRAYGSSDPDNGPFGQILCNGSIVQIGASYAGTGSYLPVSIWTGGSTRFTIDTSGNKVLGIAAIATNATNGFTYIASCAGTPTGTPTAYTGMVPMVYDSTNNKFYIYNGAWKGVTLA